MATVLVYRWLSPLHSRKRLRGAFSHPVQKEMRMNEMVYAPLPLWYTSGERGEDHLQLATYLLDVIRNVRAATEDFKESPKNFATSLELATSVFEALLLMESVQISEVPTCLMSRHSHVRWEIPKPFPASVNKVCYTVVEGPSSDQFWILDEILVYPSWRVDSPPRLCEFHADKFTYAFISEISGCVRSPGQRPERRLSV